MEPFSMPNFSSRNTSPRWNPTGPGSARSSSSSRPLLYQNIFKSDFSKISRFKNESLPWARWSIKEISLLTQLGCTLPSHRVIPRITLSSLPFNFAISGLAMWTKNYVFRIHVKPIRCTGWERHRIYVEIVALAWLLIKAPGTRVNWRNLFCIIQPPVFEVHQYHFSFEGMSIKRERVTWNQSKH